VDALVEQLEGTILFNMRFVFVNINNLFNIFKI
jgi:hypothetical protein